MGASFRTLSTKVRLAGCFNCLMDSYGAKFTVLTCITGIPASRDNGVLGASGSALPAGKRKGLCCSPLQWGGFSLSAEDGFGHHNITKIRNSWRVSKAGQ